MEEEYRNREEILTVDPLPLLMRLGENVSAEDIDYMKAELEDLKLQSSLCQKIVSAN